MPLTIGTVCAPRTSLIIADDCPAMREGLARLISDECDLVVMNSAASAAELRGCIAQQPPRVLLLELTLGEDDGLALIRDLLNTAPDMRIVVFTFQPRGRVRRALSPRGARAYVSKRDPVASAPSGPSAASPTVRSWYLQACHRPWWAPGRPRRRRPRPAAWWRS